MPTTTEPIIDFHPGDKVRHPRRGLGTVHTVAFHPISKRPSKVVVHFQRGLDVQPVVCWPDDLTVEPVPPPVTTRPTLTVVT